MGTQKSGAFALIVASGALLGACSSIVNGTSQVVSISSNPQGAQCVLNRNGEQIAQTATTPARVSISKSRHDVNVACTRPGYGSGQAVLVSRFETTTIGNLAVGGVVGLAVDAGTGAINKYDSDVMVPLTPGAQPSQRPAPAPTPGTSGVKPIS